MNDKKQSPIHLATELNKVHALKVMGNYRKIIDIQKGGEHGRTALHLAAIYDHEGTYTLYYALIVVIISHQAILEINQIYCLCYASRRMRKNTGKLGKVYLFVYHIINFKRIDSVKY